MIEGKPQLVFYDTGATLNLVKGTIAEELGMTCIDQKPANVTVVGGKVMSTEFGTYRFELGPDDNRSYHEIYAQGIPEITTPLPKHTTESIYEEVKEALGDMGTLPDYIGGGEISLLLGLKHPDLHPVKIATLPSGLGVYRSKLTDAFGSNLMFGGTHPSFMGKEDEKARGMLIRTVENHAFGRSAEDDLEQLFEMNHDKYTPVSMLGAPESHGNDIIQLTVPGEELCMAHLVSETEHICAKVSTKIQEMGIPDELDKDPFITYRCFRCSKCEDCKASTKRRNVSLKERREQEVIDKSVTVDEENQRVWASLPFMVDPVEHLQKKWGANSNFVQAKQRYNATTRRPEAHKKLMLKTMNDLIKSGFAVPLDEEPKRVQELVWSNPVQHYYVINPVVNLSSTSTPVRLVVDPTVTGLNETLACGENVTGLIAEILIRNRFSKEAWSTDISKMYNQLYLNEDSYAYSLFLWSDDLAEGSRPRVFLMKRAWYGVVPTGNQASKAINMLANNNPVGYDLGIVALLHDRYVDDVSSGADTKAAREEMINQVREILLQGGFKLKFVARSGEHPCDKASSNGVDVKLLGYSWQPFMDTLKLADVDLNFAPKSRGKRKPSEETPTSVSDLRKILENTVLTRKGVLSKVAEVFDPVGIFEPLKLQMKLRLIPLNKLDWNDVVKGPDREEWIQVFSQFIRLGELMVNRYVFPKEVPLETPIRVICVSDAAEHACGAAIYVGRRMIDGTYSCQLVTAKSRLINDTIPRNELASVLLASELAFHISKTIRAPVGQIIYVTDSAITLCWVSNTGKRLKQFVSNRVAGIRQFIEWTNTEETQEVIPLYHIDGPRNIADMLTKIQPFDVMSVGPESDWINGQPWMRLPLEEMGLTHFKDLSPDKELQSSVKKECYEDPYLITVNIVRDILCGIGINEGTVERANACTLPSGNDYYFPLFRIGWYRGVQSLAMWKKYIEHRVHKSKVIPCKQNCLFCDEDDPHFERYWAQAEHWFFMEETKLLRQEITPKQARILVEADDLLVLSGRLGEDTPIMQRDIDFTRFYDQRDFNRALVAVRPKSELLRAYIVYAHNYLLPHGSIAATIAEVEKRFHVVGRWQWMVGRYKTDCIICKLLALRTAQVRILSLPPEKAHLAPAFYNSVIDISFGFVGKPYKTSRVTVKLYALVCVCLNTSASAIYCLEGLTTEEVCAALIRHGCRYGIPKTLFVDNGTQLTSLKHARFSLLDATRNLYSSQKIDLRVGRPKAHSDRGRAEVRIRMLKEWLSKMSLAKDLKPRTALQFESAFAQASNAFNNLPIYRADGSAGRNRTFSVITPNRLILGRNNIRALHNGITLESANLPCELLEQNNLMQEEFYAVLVAHMSYFNKSKKWQTGDFIPREGDLVLFLWNDSLTKEFRMGTVIKFENNVVFIQYPNRTAKGKADDKILERSPRDMVVIHRRGEEDNNTVKYWYNLYNLEGEKVQDIEKYFPEECTGRLQELEDDQD